MKYASVIPLIGGMTIGNKIATGNDPEFFASFDAFEGNESLLHNYLPNVAKHNIETMNYPSYQGLDFISTVCPCAGLSQFNTSSSRGANAPQNEWMYKTAHIVLEKLKPQVFFGENAPGLFTKYGEGVANKLYEIGRDYGYSFSLVKTNTNLHGIPQKRERSFYFFWNSKEAPVMNFYNHPKKNLLDFLSEIPKDTEGMESMGNYAEDPFCMFMDKKMGDGWRKKMINNLEELRHAGNGVQYALKHKDEFYEFLHSVGQEKLIKKMDHIQAKLSDGKNYWDFAPTTIDYSEFTSVTSRSMTRIIHPLENRFFTYREMMYLMGMPNDFKLNHYPTDIHKVTQNVPVCTARDQTYEVMKFIKGDLESSGTTFFKQNNMTKINTKVK